MNGRANPATQHKVVGVLADLAAPRAHEQLVLSLALPQILPMRTSMLSADALPKYEEAGFAVQDTAEYLAAASGSFGHKNAVCGIGLTGAPIMRCVRAAIWLAG